MKINHKIMLFIIIISTVYSCSSRRTTNIVTQNNKQEITAYQELDDVKKRNKQRVEKKMYGILKELNLKKQIISYNLDNTGSYKYALEEIIAKEKTNLEYHIIIRVNGTSLGKERNLQEEDRADIFIKAKLEYNSIIIQAFEIDTKHLLSSKTQYLEKDLNYNYSVTDKSEKPLNYYDGIAYCQEKNKNIPNEYSAPELKEIDFLFWTSKPADDSNSAMIYDYKNQKQHFVEAMKYDTFYTICVDN